jgi:predicted ribosomally synthesized peptide with nif11-like leader
MADVLHAGEQTMSSHSEYRRFVAEQGRNHELRAAVAKLGAEDDAIVELAASKGFVFTKADIEHQAKDGELPDKQLDGVSGGAGRTGPGTQTEDDVYVG